MKELEKKLSFLESEIEKVKEEMKRIEAISLDDDRYYYTNKIVELTDKQRLTFKKALNNEESREDMKIFWTGLGGKIIIISTVSSLIVQSLAILYTTHLI